MVFTDADMFPADSVKMHLGLIYDNTSKGFWTSQLKHLAGSHVEYAELEL